MTASYYSAWEIKILNTLSSILPVFVLRDFPYVLNFPLAYHECPSIEAPLPYVIDFSALLYPHISRFLYCSTLITLYPLILLQCPR